jgi:zinc and cadmium transporter
MERDLVLTLIATAVDGAAALTGGLIPTRILHSRLKPLLAFAAGTLIGVAAIELAPEALHELSWPAVLGWALAGWAAFAIIERVFGMHSAGQHGHRSHTGRLTGPFLLVGDALHNFTDGVALAIAFRQGPSVGFATTLAVVLHEVPQEIGDYAILRAQGYGKARALVLLTLVQLTAFPGALLVFGATRNLDQPSAIIAALVAGGFLYIAIADLIPETRFRKAEVISFICGVALIAALAGARF